MLTTFMITLTYTVSNIKKRIVENYKKISLYLFNLIFCFFNSTTISFAEEEDRMDKKVLTGVLTIVQMGSFIFLALAIYDLIGWLYQKEPEKKDNAIKYLFYFAIAQMLLPAAKVGNFAY